MSDLGRFPDPDASDVTSLAPEDQPSPPVSASNGLGAEAIEEAFLAYGIQGLSPVDEVRLDRVVRYEFRVAPPTKMKQVAALEDELAYHLGVTDVQILAPIPGRTAIGVEVPDPTAPAPEKFRAEPADAMGPSAPAPPTDQGGRDVVAALEEYGIKGAQVIGKVTGARVSRYELQMPVGASLQVFTAALERDLEYALGAAGLRVLAPIPGRRAVGIEIPNDRGPKHAPLVELHGDVEPEPPKPCYETLGDFVEQYLFPLYRRKVGGGKNDVRWCAQWWSHAEALTRLEALWRSWETLRLDPGTGMAVWLRDYLDPHMTMLLSEHGTFANCTIAHEKRGDAATHREIPKLPHADAPKGLLDAAATPAGLGGAVRGASQMAARDRSVRTTPCTAILSSAGGRSRSSTSQRSRRRTTLHDVKDRTTAARSPTPWRNTRSLTSTAASASAVGSSGYRPHRTSSKSERTAPRRSRPARCNSSKRSTSTPGRWGSTTASRSTARFSTPSRPTTSRDAATTARSTGEVAALASELVETYGPSLDRFHIADAREHLDKRASDALSSLFYDPIWWTPDDTGVSNGQHRTCALRVGGAERVPVAPGEI